MSAPMRKRHTKSKQAKKRKAMLYVIEGKKAYAIPRKIADQYVVSAEELASNAPAEIVFAELENRYGKAGVLLKGLRVREGLTQEQFAAMIEVTQANLSSMENGKRPIGKDIAKRIEKKFSVNYRYFL